jgi:anti-sigma factor RsiW
MNMSNDPDDIETLLPWHAAGTLDPRDTKRVEDALRRDPELARRYALVREELAETIQLNESLGAPSARAMEALFRQIDREPKSLAHPSFDFVNRLSGFFASLSPRTLAWSATGAAVALLLQAGLIAGILLNDGRTNGAYQKATAPGSHAADGSFVMIRFASEVKAAEITSFLHDNNLTIAGGPIAGGLYRVQVSESKMPKEQLAERARQLQQDKRVDLIATVE